MSVKLVSNWRRAHLMLSNQLLVIDTGLVATWAELPQEFKAAIESHPSWMVGGAIVWCLVKFFARLVDQGSKVAA